MVMGAAVLAGQAPGAARTPAPATTAGPIDPEAETPVVYAVGTVDRSVSQTDSPDPVTVGSNVTYSLMVANVGPDVATAVSLTDTLPPSMSFVSSSASQGTCTSTTTVTCDLGDVPSGGTASVTIVAMTTTTGTFTNTATVSGNDTDTNTANDTAREGTTVTGGTVLVNVADYSFTPSAAVAQEGATVQWNFQGPNAHTATDSSGMNLFDSGSMPAGTIYVFTFTAAGIYPYRSTAAEPSAMTGTIRVPLKVAPAAGDTSTPFLVTWSSAAPPSGYVFDAQVRYPAATTFVNWQTGQTATGATFLPDHGTGTYTFRGRLRATVTGKASAWSPYRSVPVAGATSRPNLVVILSDDQRADSLSSMPTVRSELQGKGITFTNGFVSNSICCPARASILTGNYSGNNGVWTNGGPYGGFSSFKRDNSTIATWLQAGGYQTGLVGKYLNQYEDPGPCGHCAYIPPGWDRWFATTGHTYAYNTDWFVSDQGVNVEYKSTYKTDLLAQKASEFIRGVNPSKPLFLYFSPPTPHSPASPPSRYKTTYDNVTIPRAPSYDEADVSDKPAYIKGLPPLTTTEKSWIDNTYRNTLGAERALDDGVATILQALSDTGRLANTMIVYMSDNGYSWGEHRWGGKMLPYEEDMRVPFIIRDDALGLTPRSDPRWAVNIDIAPTFAARANITPASPTDGSNLLPLLKDPSLGGRQDFLLEHVAGGTGGTKYWGGVPDYCGVRGQGYMYTVYKTGEEEYYDLISDPYELVNRASSLAYANQVQNSRARVRTLCRPAPPGWPFW